MTNCDGASDVDSRQTEQSVSRGERRYVYSMAACNICAKDTVAHRLAVPQHEQCGAIAVASQEHINTHNWHRLHEGG